MTDMTHLMKQAIERVQALPENQQNELARFLLHELQEDDRWAVSTESNVSKLQELTNRILADDAAGNCEPLDPDKL